MNKSVNLTINRPGYSIELLKPEDAPILQTIYDRCIDFAILTYGEPFGSTAATDEFKDLPPGKTQEDKYIFGLLDLETNLLAIIESIKHYPDDRTWWLGLMMLIPEKRGQGLAKDFYRAFENWVSRQRIDRISLIVIEANERGLKFWKSLGFEMISKRENKKFGNKIHAVYVMSRALKIA